MALKCWAENAAILSNTEAVSSYFHRIIWTDFGLVTETNLSDYRSSFPGSNLCRSNLLVSTATVENLNSELELKAANFTGYFGSD